MESMLHQQSVAQAFLKNRESKSDARKAHLYQQMPVTPVYSRPGSSCSQPPTLYSNGAHKTAIMLDTDVYDNYFPSTPALSTSGSAIGSPKMCDAMQTPVNPMFSGLDGAFHGKDLFDSVETSVLDWSSCASPPMTPVYIASQPPALQHSTSDLISMTSCPSLSPSPTPAYARSIAASEQDLDFCDPRNLTVSAGSNPTLAPEFSLTNAGDAEVKGANAQSTFDFNPAIPHGLPAFQDLDDLDSEDDFSNLVNIEASGAETTRPRACTGSSVVSLGHCSFDDELTFEDSDSFSFMPFPNADITPSVDGHCDKKQKKSHEDTVDADELAEADPELTSGDSVSSESTVSSPGDDSTPSVAAPPSRRGRKQSLTEDPSKTFVCDLCNRRFRRQEHLKRHYRSLHTQEKPFECNECGKKFSRSDNLAQHARTHSGGAIVMDLIEDHASHFDGNAMAGPGDDFSYGKVMFQIGSEVSDMSEDVSDNNNKKRKRSD